MKSIEIPFEEKVINGLLSEATHSKALITLSHGAGAPMTHSFMEQLTEELLDQNLSVLRFNFPYMDQGRKTPGSPKPNILAWGAVVDWATKNISEPLFISGKSYGGRMGSHLLAETPNPSIKGIIYYGFPLHAPGRNSKDRAAHLVNIQVPQLFLQGTKDALAKIDLVQEVCSELPKAQLIKLENADHSFKTKGKKIEEVVKQLALETRKWMQGIL